MADADKSADKSAEQPEEKSGDKERSRDRSRSRDKESRRSRRSRSKRRSRERRRSRSTRRDDRRDRRRDDRRERRRSRTRSRSRDRRGRSPSREKKSTGGAAAVENENQKAKRERKEMEENLTPEQRMALDADRDQRTVFVFQLSVKSTDEDVFGLFENAGKVRDVRLITDRNTRKSKGFGYVEFYERDSIPRAIALSGTIMRGIPVMVKFSEAEKNLAAQQANAAAVNTVGPMKLYVGNLHPNVAEGDLRALFSPFGDVESVQIHKDGGFGFVHYRNAEEAKMALGQLNGFEVAG